MDYPIEPSTDELAAVRNPMLSSWDQTNSLSSLNRSTPGGAQMLSKHRHTFKRSKDHQMPYSMQMNCCLTSHTRWIVSFLVHWRLPSTWISSRLMSISCIYFKGWSIIQECWSTIIGQTEHKIYLSSRSCFKTWPLGTGISRLTHQCGWHRYRCSWSSWVQTKNLI